MSRAKTHKSRSNKWKFHKVVDTKGNPVPNLWVRNYRYYAQLTLKNGRDKNTKRALKATSLPTARDELEELRVMRRNNQLALRLKYLDFTPIVMITCFTISRYSRKALIASVRKRAHKTLEKHLGDILLRK